MAQISIAEIQTNFIPNANHLCETWSYEEYLEHQRNKIIDQSLSNITCTIFNLKDIMDPKKSIITNVQYKRICSKNISIPN